MGARILNSRIGLTNQRNPTRPTLMLRVSKSALEEKNGLGKTILTPAICNTRYSGQGGLTLC
jgi:hypothetical protein